MAFERPSESYSGKIREIELGSKKKVKVGGEGSMPLYLFEGAAPNATAVAMEVFDAPHDEWPEAVKAPFKDVFDSPPAWARKVVDEYGADMVCVQLASTDPNGQDTSPEKAAQTVLSVASEVDVPLIIYGSGNVEKDPPVLKEVAEACAGMNLLIGPAQEDNYKQITAAALAYGHKVIAETPIDVNLAKQLNILISNMGMSLDNVVMDPSTGALGYGLEYSYSVMERDRLAALTQGDDKMQQPLICNLGKEAWKVKEAKISQEEEPSFGTAETRGFLWEAVTAQAFAMAGADILVMRHPQAVALLRKSIGALTGR